MSKHVKSKARLGVSSRLVLKVVLFPEIKCLCINNLHN